MPKKQDINKILIIGSGPIIIGQACEFDYSGTQACKALRKLGYQIVLVNSNPATIMTDPDVADITYIEPLNVDRLTQIIEKERPDALLPNLGGQSGLNLCSELSEAGVLEKYNVQVIGVQVDAIERGEDRIEFKHTMEKLGIEMPRSEVAYSVEEAVKIADKLKYPVVLRPAYTMGGAGGGMVYNIDELKVVCARGLQASLVGQVLVEECISGWEELELEVVRDANDNVITVCFIENIDPIGVHTGDSFCSAPMLTISEDVQKKLQEYSYKIVKAIEESLEKKFARLATTESMEIGGINYVAEIMNNVDRATEKYIFDELSARDQKLADLIKQKMFVFEDIVQLDAKAIQEFAKQVDSKDLAIALKGSTQEVAECIFSNISTRARESLQADIEYLHNVRMRDVEDAQQRIVGVIRRLEQEGALTIARGGGDEIIA